MGRMWAVDAAKTTTQTKIIRDFSLYARVPHRRPKKLSRTATRGRATTSRQTSEFNRELAQPSGRERKASGFLLKLLDTSVAFAESFGGESTARPQHELVRQWLDLAILAVIFESSLIGNSVRSNRRVVMASCKLIQIVSDMLKNMTWSPEEGLLIVLGFTPLMGDSVFGTRGSMHASWTALIEPGERTGIRRDVLHSETFLRSTFDDEDVTSRDLQRIIWQSSDVSMFLESAKSLTGMNAYVTPAPRCISDSEHCSESAFGQSKFNGENSISKIRW